MPAKTAAELKELGNEKFKQRSFVEAVELYIAAESFAPGEAVYPSNLSAAFFELGDYAASFQAIRRAFQNISNTDDVLPLSARLSIRLAKVLSHGVRDGSISSEMLKDDGEILDRVSALVDKPDAGGELVAAWKAWQRVDREREKVLRGTASAKARLLSLPIFRKSTNPGLDYFTIGHDDPMSIIDDWGPNDPDPIDLRRLSPSHLSHLSFLFGGVGDARHVFSSIIGLHRAHQRLGVEKQSQLNAHFTLLDIHATAIARDLCIFLLLDELAADRLDEEGKTETLATIFYIFIGVLIPPYCFAKFRTAVRLAIAKLQQSPPTLPPWLHVVADTIPSILDALHLWEKGITGKTIQGMLRAHKEDPTELLHHTGEYLGEPISVPRGVDPQNVDYTALAALSMQMHKTSDEEVIQFVAPSFGPCPGLSHPRERKFWLKEAREAMLSAMLQAREARGESSDATPKELKQEKTWYNDMSVLVPPASLRKRHPAFDELWFNVRTGKMRSSKRAQDLIHKAYSHVLQEWKPNPSLFDRIYADGPCYPDTKIDPIGWVITQIFEFNIRMGLDASKEEMNDSPCYTTVKTFFAAVADGIRALQGHIKVELLSGELVSKLASMRLNADHHRPEEFPRKYTRMWLSNVPDYTHGVLNTALFAVPGLQDLPCAVVGANCMLNSPVWKDDTEFCHQYTLLLPPELPRFLGCVFTQTGRHLLTKLQRVPTPLPLSQLASHDDLNIWLCRVLFAILVPGVTSLGEMDRIFTPNNLAAFVKLLIYLHSVGFPAHWLSGFLSPVLSNNLVSDVTPYHGNYPTPVSEHARRVARRKVDLKPWHADLEHVLVMVYDALPFPVVLPKDFTSSVADIATYEVQVSAYNISPTAAINSPQQVYPVVSLLFYKSRTSYTVEDFAMNVHSLLEGTYGVSTDVHIITTVESFDLTCGRMSWRMARKRVARMVREGWVMGAFPAGLAPQL
ncbi:hypothetical protein EIP91_005902 [Steccherinum ochraceum]|uniref:DUF4470 domain-containing protein n=1 Tax=Steccherinum ochraceum TaxID=92696 RepID=A0A4R0R9A6_9APHY|nr:hypothetical protein EIP91_005902 [Steccherinum ochraceum]